MIYNLFITVPKPLTFDCNSCLGAKNMTTIIEKKLRMQPLNCLKNRKPCFENLKQGFAVCSFTLIA